MDALNYRFAVGSLEGFRSSSYSIFTNSDKSDIYVGHRGVLGYYKASLHESGKNHMGFTAQTKHPHALQKIKMNNGKRHMHQWQGYNVHPLEILIHFRIVFPTSELRILKKDVNTKPINWIEPAPTDHQLEVCILTGPSLISNYPKPYGLQSILLQDFLLPNKTKLWIIAVTNPHDPNLFKGPKNRGSSNPSERGIGSITSGPIPGFVDFAMY